MILPGPDSSGLRPPRPLTSLKATGSSRRNSGCDRNWRNRRLLPKTASRAYRPFVGPILKGSKGSRNYGDRDKRLAPLSLCESR
jgi:hypothetical protein